MSTKEQTVSRPMSRRWLPRRSWGHEYPTITFGTYGKGGITLEQKRETMERAFVYEGM
jgi:hypothetical protein